jgi:hypothetical protein
MDKTPHTASLPPDTFPQSPKLNVEEYRDSFADSDLTTEQQNELLQALWDIMARFVELGWEVETVPEFLPELFENTSQAIESDRKFEDGNTDNQ